MDAIKLTVRCMAWPEGEVWVAACIDLTLAAQGATRLQAQQRLHAQILSYVREAVTIDAEHAEALLGRRAPWRDRLRFAFWHKVGKLPLAAAFRHQRAQVRAAQLSRSLVGHDALHSVLLQKTTRESLAK